MQVSTAWDFKLSQIKNQPLATASKIARHISSVVIRCPVNAQVFMWYLIVGPQLDYCNSLPRRHIRFHSGSSLVLEHPYTSCHPGISSQSHLACSRWSALASHSSLNKFQDKIATITSNVFQFQRPSLSDYLRFAQIRLLISHGKVNIFFICCIKYFEWITSSIPGRPNWNLYKMRFDVEFTWEALWLNSRFCLQITRRNRSSMFSHVFVVVQAPLVRVYTHWPAEEWTC